MTDIAALITAVSGLSGLVTAVAGAIPQIKGKEDKDDKRVTEAVERLQGLQEVVPKIGALSWSLHEYIGLQASSGTLKTQIEIFQRSYPPTPPDPKDEQMFRYVVDSNYRNIKSFYTVNLAVLSNLVATRAFDEADKRTIADSLRQLDKTFAQADTLLGAAKLDFPAFRAALNTMSDAVDGLLGLAQAKARLIVESLMAIAAQPRTG
jgi:hypothetical protein